VAAVEPAVACEAVTKHFHYYERKENSLRLLLAHLFSRRPAAASRAKFSINDVTLRVAQGESVAIVGRNGSGKSTLLRLIAGIYCPTRGSVRRHGRIGAAIELGAGFHPELTGSENIYLYGAILGMDRTAMAARRRQVVEFADIGDFVDVPVKYYSSGMQARLAFAVAVCVEHEILLLDEVLAVGDERFRRKCIAYLKEYHARGGTLILTSHDLGAVRDLCTRALWLEAGSVRMTGDVQEVAGAYEQESRAAS
jgi:ABC-type polysaccharide/polyol phosphate transport system ATPase subunit